MNFVFHLIFTPIALIVAFTSCSQIIQPGKPLHFVVPDGYEGVFEIVIDEKNGSEPKVENGRLVYRIPPSGVLAVKSIEPFQEPHKETAEYYRGDILIVDNSNRKKDEVALRNLGGYGSKPTNGINIGPTNLVFIVGTLSDAGDYWTETLSGARRIGKKQQQ